MIDQRLNCCIHSTAPCSLDAWRNASQKMSVTKRDRRRYRLENEIVAAKKCRRAKNRESRQWQSGSAENRAADLTARRCDVGMVSVSKH